MKRLLPAPATGYVLQSNSQMTGTNWTNVLVVPQQIGDLMQVVLPTCAAQAFHRLQKQ